MNNDTNNLRRRDLFKSIGYFTTGLALAQLASCAQSEQVTNTETTETDSASISG